MTVSNDKHKPNQDKESAIGGAVEAALAEMPDSFVIKSLLLENKAAVKEMLIAEFEEEKMLREMAKHRKKPKGK